MVEYMFVDDSLHQFISVTNPYNFNLMYELLISLIVYLRKSFYIWILVAVASMIWYVVAVLVKIRQNPVSECSYLGHIRRFALSRATSFLPLYAVIAVVLVCSKYFSCYYII